MFYTCKNCLAVLDTLNVDVSSGCCPECHRKFPGNYAGKFVRDFQVVGEIARGANGIVYLAQQPWLRRELALKLMLTEFTGETEAVNQFFIEARAAARLDHPNIVQAYAAGVDENRLCYYAMELLEGVSVEQRLDKFGALDFGDALYIGTRIAEALAYTWQRVKLIHGDLKPANIIVDKNNEPKLTDFGQAHFADGEFDPDSVMATPLYASPELVRGEYDKIGVKTDIYSFGATLYEMFSGEPPLFSLEMEEVMKMQLDDVPVSLSARLGFFDPALSDYIDRMLAKNPDLRPDSWREVAEFLRKIELRIQNTELR